MLRAPLSSHRHRLSALLLALPLTACGDSGTDPVAPSPATVVVNAPSPSLVVGETLQLTATVLDGEGRPLSGATVTWSSSRPERASVDGQGQVTAVAAGEVTITAAAGGATGRVDLTVLPVPVASVTVTPDAVELLVGDTARLEVEVRDGSGDVIAGREAAWSSAAPEVATVDESGWVRGAGEGTAVVTVTVEGVRDSARVVVRPVPVARVVVEPATLTLRVGQAATLQATALDDRDRMLEGREVAWSSTAPDVADVTAGGAVSARTAGSAHVVATVERVADSVEVTVMEHGGGLSPADTERLTVYLDQLAGGWVQAAVDGANGILTSAAYTSADYRAFFAAYFVERPLTRDLHNYLRYPVFWWFDDAVHRRLQTALLPVVGDRMTATLLEHGDGLEEGLGDDLEDQTLISLADLLWQFAAEGLPEFRAPVDHFFRDLMDDHPHLFHEHVSERRGLRRLNAMAFLGALAAEPLTAGRRAELVSRFRLTGRAAAIFAERGVFVYERLNHDGVQKVLDDGQLRAIDDVLDVVPPELHDLLAIHILDAFGLFPGFYHCCFYTRPYDLSIISIGEPPLGPMENPFPDDVEPRPTPFFTTIFVHELGHVIDNVQHTGDEGYRARKEALVAAAGRDSLNYLRSMIPAGSFADHPVEFFASTSQQWLADTEHTLRLARQRFDGGRPHPLNQALWMAETFSLGGSGTPLFDMTDPEGSVSVGTTSLTRDANGHIARLVVGDSVYTFQRNATGDVLSYTFGPRQ